MSHSVRTTGQKIVNGVLGRVGFKIVNQSSFSDDYRAYIPWKVTVDGARAAGVSVGDYIDAQHNVPGATQRTIDQMAALGAFSGHVDRVCEIGPGSGRYLERTLRAVAPSHYEIYETSDDWGNWLAQTYGVVSLPCDGFSLGSTPDDSIDLVHAHKVLPGQPSLVICRYLSEMARVVRPGGKIVFDIVTESCLDDDVLALWLDSGSSYQHYPCLFPRQFAVGLLERRGCGCDGSFHVDMKPGLTECLVFTKAIA